jgi:hypothetical protein
MILNIKIFLLILKFKKYSVRRFAPCPVRVLDKFPHGKRFFSPYGKISPRALNPPTKCKQFILSQFPHGENHGFLYMFCINIIKFTARGEIFTVRGEKSLAVQELVQDTYRARSEAANPIHIKF